MGRPERLRGLPGDTKADGLEDGLETQRHRRRPRGHQRAVGSHSFQVPSGTLTQTRVSRALWVTSSPVAWVRCSVSAPAHAGSGGACHVLDGLLSFCVKEDFLFRFPGAAVYFLKANVYDFYN